MYCWEEENTLIVWVSNDKEIESINILVGVGDGVVHTHGDGLTCILMKGILIFYSNNNQKI